MMYIFFKLINGDNILATVPDEDYMSSTETIILQDPVILNVVRYLRSGALVEAYVFSNWFNNITSNIVSIHINNIIASAEAKEDIIEQYNKFLQYSNDSDELSIHIDDQYDDELDEEISSNEEDNSNESSRTIH